jgi:hypothetical protein
MADSDAPPGLLAKSCCDLDTIYIMIRPGHAAVDIFDVLVEFLEAVVHEILYVPLLVRCLQPAFDAISVLA